MVFLLLNYKPAHTYKFGTIWMRKRIFLLSTKIKWKTTVKFCLHQETIDWSIKVLPVRWERERERERERMIENTIQQSLTVSISVIPLVNKATTRQLIQIKLTNKEKCLYAKHVVILTPLGKSSTCFRLFRFSSFLPIPHRIIWLPISHELGLPVRYCTVSLFIWSFCFQWPVGTRETIMQTTVHCNIIWDAQRQRYSIR